MDFSRLSFSTRLASIFGDLPLQLSARLLIFIIASLLFLLTWLISQNWLFSFYHLAFFVFALYLLWEVALFQHVKAHQQGEEKQRLLSAILDNLTEGVYMVRVSDACIIFSNPQFDAMFGYKTGELPGQHVSVLNAPGERSPEETARIIMDELKHAGVWRGEVKNIRKDGSVFCCSAVVTAFNHADFGPVWVCTQQDISERKEAELLRLAHLEKLDKLTAAIPGVVYQSLRQTDGDWRFLYLSPSVFEFYEVTPEQAYANHNALIQCIVQEDRASHHESLKQSFHHLSPWRHEHRIRTQSGRLKWVRGQSIPEVCPDGSVLWHGILIDITDSKQTEEELRHSHAMLAWAEEISHVGSWEWNPATDMVRWSDELFRLFQIHPAEGAPTFADHDKLYMAEDMPMLRNVISAALRDGEPYTLKLRAVRRDGEIRHCIARGLTERDEQGAVTRLYGYMQDITEAHRREVLLRSQQDLFESLAGYWDWWIQQNEAYLSPSFKHMFGYADDEMENSRDSWRQIIFAEDLPKILDVLQRHVDSHGKVPYYNEVRYRHKNGGTVWVICAGKVVEWDEQNRPLRMIGCHIDITARKQAEEALIRARDAANAANQAKSAFLANMSHELRTPLNAVMGFAQVLEFSPRLNETDKQQVNSIYKGGQYLLTLINDILDLAKIEAGRIELYPENIEVHSFFQELAEMLRFRAEKKGVIFSYQLDDTLPDAIVTDAKRLRQVIMNLLGNAVKFTSQGQVVLRVSFQAPNLHIRVADTGPGIAPEHHADIFQPFSQVGDKKQNAEGTGLGLSITHKIVELMRGHIELDSQLGQGSVFRLQIPVETRVILPVEDANPLPLPHHISAYERTDDNSHALRILLVDDVADNRAILRHMLEPLGFELEQCDSGETCLQCAPSFAPDLVLLDLRMPVLDGLATLRKFHELPGMADIPVVMVSASAYEHDQTNARAAGCVDYLSKPVDRAALLQTLQKHLALAWQYSDAISQRQTTYTRLDAQQRAELLRLTQRGEVDAVMAKLAHLCETQNSPSQAHKLLELARSFQLSELQQQLKMPEND